MNWFLTILALIMSVNLYGAESPAPKPEVPPATSQTKQQADEPTEKATKQPNEAPVDTLGGTGLKNRKLSEVFEKFVPSESISADNAVPFPVDI